MIRKLTEEDFDEAVNVICKSFMTVAEEYDITKENAPAYTAFATDVHKLRTWMYEQHRPMYGYFDGDKMIGYYNLMIKDKECELGSLSVLPEYRHRNIGLTLLEDSLSNASEYGCTIMKLSIVEENTVLRKWYEKHGFIHTGTVKYDFFPFVCGYMEKRLEETPNAETLAATKEVEEMKKHPSKHKSYSDVDDMMEDLLK